MRSTNAEMAADSPSAKKQALVAPQRYMSAFRDGTRLQQCRKKIRLRDGEGPKFPAMRPCSACPTRLTPEKGCAADSLVPHSRAILPYLIQWLSPFPKRRSACAGAALTHRGVRLYRIALN